MPLQEEIEQRGNWLFRKRGVLPLIILIVGLLVNIFLKYQPAIIREVITNHRMLYEFLCLIICFLGLAIRVFTVAYTPKGTSGRNVDKQLADSLNTKGIYSVVRHPLYLGNYFMWLGVSLLTCNLWFVLFFTLIYWIYYTAIMFAEEQFLRNKFGQAYLDWASKTPAIIPNFKLYQKSDLYFSWRKVLKKEKNGFVAIFLVFCMFDISEKLYLSSFEFNKVWIYLAIVASFIYLLLRTIKYKTNWLNEENR